MRVLVLSGEVTHTRPMSYGLPHNWDVRYLSLVDSEYLVLCEKYGDSKEVPSADVIGFLRRAYDRAIAHVERSEEIDIIIGVGHGAHVLMNLRTAHEWTGPSVYVMSEGNARYNFAPRTLADEIDYTVRRGESVMISISNLDDKTRRPTRGGYSRKCLLEKKSVMQISLRGDNWQDRLYGTDLLKTCAEIAFNPHSNNLDLDPNALRLGL
jgi:hypothetical protein